MDKVENKEIIRLECDGKDIKIFAKENMMYSTIIENNKESLTTALYNVFGFLAGYKIAKDNNDIIYWDYNLQNKDQFKMIKKWVKKRLKHPKKSSIDIVIYLYIWDGYY